MIEIFDVICIGAALVDMIAQVERHPSDDDEVFVSKLNLLSGGAAANTAYACGKMGLTTAFIGKLGKNDVFNNMIENDFKEALVDTSLVKYSENYKTGSAYVALNNKGDRRIYAHSGAANYLSENDILEEDISDTRLIFLSSLKNIEPLLHAAKIGRNNNKTVILNPGMLIIDQGFDKIKSLLEIINILILSEREFKTLFNFNEISINGDLIEEGSMILFALGIKAIIVTLGKKGAFLITAKQKELIEPFNLVKAVDTTGAGDAFSAGFIYALVKKMSLKFEHLRNGIIIGNFVAGRCIQKLGARNGIPGGKELGIFLRNANKKI